MHPFGQSHTRAATGRDPERVESGTDIELPVSFRRFTKYEVAIGREAFRAVDQLIDPGSCECGNTAHRKFHRRGKVVEVGVEQLKLNPAGSPARPTAPGSVRSRP